MWIHICWCKISNATFMVWNQRSLTMIGSYNTDISGIIDKYAPLMTRYIKLRSAWVVSFPGKNCMKKKKYIYISIYISILSQISSKMGHWKIIWFSSSITWQKLHISRFGLAHLPVSIDSLRLVSANEI